MSATPYESYVICTSPRSGSTLLCKLLAATGVAGKPESYFHEPSIADWREDIGLAPDASASEHALLSEVFSAVIAEGRGGADVFGLRLQRHSFDFFVQKLAVLHPRPATDRERFETAFGRTLFIHLAREDKVEQAVSYVKAEQSGLWHRAPDGSELERLSPPRELRYDPDLVGRQVEAMAAMDAAWLDWFEREGIAPLRLAYDRLAADPIGTLAVVLKELGLDASAASGVTPGVAKLADETSRRWVARFRAEQGARDRSDLPRP